MSRLPSLLIFGLSLLSFLGFAVGVLSESRISVMLGVIGLSIAYGTFARSPVSRGFVAAAWGSRGGAWVDLVRIGFFASFWIIFGTLVGYIVHG